MLISTVADRSARWLSVGIIFRSDVSFVVFEFTGDV